MEVVLAALEKSALQLNAWKLNDRWDRDDEMALDSVNAAIDALNAQSSPEEGK